MSKELMIYIAIGLAATGGIYLLIKKNRASRAPAGSVPFLAPDGSTDQITESDYAYMTGESI